MHTPPPTKIPILGVGGGERREWMTGGSHWLGVGATPAVPTYLSPQVLDDLQVMPPVSDLGSLLLQVFPDFALQSPVICLQAPHLLQVGGQAVIQVLHGLLLALDAPYTHQTPGHPGAQVPGPPAAPDAGGAGHGDPGARAPGACIDAGRAADRSDPVARRLHGAQGPVVGEGGLGAEAHDACSRGKSEARTQVLGRGVCEVRNSSYSSQGWGRGWGPDRRAPPPLSESPRKPGSQVGPRGLGALGFSPSRPFPAPSAPPHQGLPPPPREGVSEWDRASQGQKVKLTLAAGISGQEMTLLYPPFPGGGRYWPRREFGG